jgi:tripartite-type tricarboxylate transporter receptor subunit TctC
MENGMRNATSKLRTMASVLWLTAVLGAAAAHAQAYPTRPITVVVPFAAGSASDVVTRVVVDHMGNTLGQRFVIDNRPGAGGNIGTAVAAKASPDGYTIVMGASGPFAANRSLFQELGFDPEKDFEPIGLFASFPNIVVASAKLPVTSVAELVAYAKSRPGVLNYGSVGVGSSQHLAGVFFEQVTGVQLTHVPYRNIGQYGPDLMSGAVPLGFQWYPNVSAPIQAGGAKPLAVASTKRLDALPDVPTSAEAGIPAYITSGWIAFLAPHGTPKPIVDKLHAALAAAVADPTIRARCEQLGAHPEAGTPEDLAKFIVAETAKWREITQRGGVPMVQ